MSLSIREINKASRQVGLELDNLQKLSKTNILSLNNDAVTKCSNTGASKNNSEYLANNSNNNTYASFVLAEKVAEIFQLFKKILYADSKNSNSKVFCAVNNKNFIQQIIQQVLFGFDENAFYKQAKEQGLNEQDRRFLLQILDIITATIDTHKNKSIRLNTPEEVFKNFFFLNTMEREFFYMTSLDRNLCIKDSKQIAKGTGNRLLIHPKDVLGEAIKIKASSIIAVHNHPSGKIIPSEHDLMFTKKLHQACQLIGIRLLDHVIIGDHYFSFLENELLIN